MIDKNIGYDALVEAEAVADTYARRKPDCLDITAKEWEVASDDTRLLLIYTQQLAKYLGEVYMEAERQGNQERVSLLYQILKGRPYLSSIDPNINVLYECIERELEFKVSTRLWIQGIKRLLYQDFL